MPISNSELPYEVEVVCCGPDHCPDDLCAHSDVGLCGLPRREYDAWSVDADDDVAEEWWDDEREITDNIVVGTTHLTP